jgi:Cys-tRNA(Pro)/Cys-tRNA(Cys) deacylase
MTPAIDLVRRHLVAHIIHEYQHDPASSAYGREAIEKLAVCQHRVFKTLVVDLGKRRLAVAIIPALSKLSLKQTAKHFASKKVIMANASDVQRSTGYVLGGVSPLGQKRLLPTLLDQSAAQFDTIYVSAGRRGLEIELSSNDLVLLSQGKLADIAETHS